MGQHSSPKSPAAGLLSFMHLMFPDIYRLLLKEDGMVHSGPFVGAPL